MFAITPHATREQTSTFGDAASLRWKRQGTDVWGHTNAWEEMPAGTGTTNTVWTAQYFVDNLLLTETGSPGFPETSKYYNAYQNNDSSVITTNDISYDGNDSYSAIYPNDNDTLARRCCSSESDVLINGEWFHISTNYVYLNDNSSQMTISSVHQEQLNGFQGNVIGYAIDYDANTNESTTTTYLNRSAWQTTITTNEPEASTLSATNVYQNGLFTSSSTLSIANPTEYGYDSLGRTNTIQDPQGNVTSMAFDPITGWLTSVTDPARNTTTYTYYGVTAANAGKLYCQTAANSKNSYYDYTQQGQLYHTWGDVAYPAEYRYDEYGELTNLLTFRGGTGWTGSSWPSNNDTAGDNTFWVYDPASGALISKTDAQNHSVLYTYDSVTGRLVNRSWARTIVDANNNVENVTVTNQYDCFGDVTEKDYNDGTPTVQFVNFNRVGQPTGIIDGAGTSQLIYDYASRLVSSTYIQGLLAGITVSNRFNPYYGKDALMVDSTSGSGWTLESDYGYDGYGRLSGLTNGVCTALYAYVPNSDLLQSTSFKSNGTSVMTTTRSWNYGFQLASIANTIAGGSIPVSSHTYNYDNVNRRTEAVLEDGSFWQYSYDNRNEVTGANRKWQYLSTVNPVAGQQFAYSYDNIGNRAWAQYGGNTNGYNLQTISYTVDSLNEYTTVVNPGAKEIVGAALVTNIVTVNGLLADRHAGYFHNELAINNASGCVWQNIAVTSGGTTSAGGCISAANAQALAYDPDGNLIFDGTWSYQWDAENRLVSMWLTNGVAGIATSNVLKLNFAYDGLGRRIQKVLSTWNGSMFGNAMTNKYIYDGWNVVAALNSQAALLQSFVWGQDLSGTLTKAAGIGGLLIANISGTNCFVAYDGNGNVTSLINATDESIAARYEYDPYGDLIRETGLFAYQNPFRFSTKYWDNETGLISYPSRYYSPSSGRWLSRDPLDEKGGINLLCFVKNSPIITFDSLGKSSGTLGDTDAAMSEGESVSADGAGAADGILGEVQQTANTFNEIQEESYTLMESADGDTTDLYIDLLNNADSELGEGFGDMVSGYGRTGVEQYDKHHIFPQQFAKDFEDAGIDIDQWLVRLKNVDHVGVHQGGWNADWGAFLEGGGKSASDMFQFALDMMQKYGCDASVLY